MSCHLFAQEFREILGYVRIFELLLILLFIWEKFLSVFTWPGRTVFS